MPCALVTGASGVFGFHIVSGLLSAGWEVFAHTRDAPKFAALQSRLASCGVPTALARPACADLSSPSSIAALSAVLPPVLDVLINNAAVTPPTRAVSAAGEELQWAVNVLAYQRLTRAALPRLLAAPAPRVVNVASSYAGGLDLADPEFVARAYDADAAYRASKMANRMLSSAWAEREPRIRFSSCHPGVATSAVSLGLGFGLDKSERAAKAGAVTPLFLAMSDAPAAAAPNGAFFSDSKVKRCAFSEDRAAVAALWAAVEGRG